MPPAPSSRSSSAGSGATPPGSSPTADRPPRRLRRLPRPGPASSGAGSRRYGLEVQGRRAQRTGHRAQGTGHRAQGTGHRAPGTGHRAPAQASGLCAQRRRRCSREAFTPDHSSARIE
ncbi:hypothetical protein CIK69_01325 [Brachybacterium alimentarium]|nr:hypothetical protein CIK69_01325 [Brachybacterium alimentarium]